MTVAELGQRMTEEEFREWLEFFNLYPFDDFHRLHRPAALVSVSLSGGNEAWQDRINFLQPEPKLAGMSDVDKSILKAFAGGTGTGGG